MNIAIVNSISIPSGEASVNRILSYSKELVFLGHSVSIVSAGKSQNETGTISGVHYRNLGNRNPFSTLHHVLSVLRKESYDVVIIVSNSLLLIYPVVILSIFKKFKVLQEKSEFPFVLMKKGILSRAYSSFYINTTYRLFDGMIIMTKPLMDYFSTLVKKKCRLFEMPMTVDVDRFSRPPSANTLGDYFAYCGNLSNRKDGIVNLIDSFVKVEQKYPLIKLVLIGGTSDEEYLSFLKEHVKELGLNNVVFYGKVSREEMPSLLLNSKALLLARPSNLQSSGGFPTKLGEYLSTGNPVVVTSVGDIPLYLNNDNSFIVPPDDNDKFSDAMLAVLDNYEHSLLIGAQGKQLALNVFNAKVQTKRLEEYLLSLL